MASVSRNLARAAFKSTPTSAFKTSTRNTAFTLPRQTFRQQSRRGYASEPSKSSSSGLYISVGALAIAGAGGYYFYSQGNGSLLSGSAGETKGVFTPKFEDYQKVYNEIAERLEEKDDYDDGSYGPVLLRLAWHASGTYDKETGTGGSNGATMRFYPEGGHGANAGLQTARDFLEPVKRVYLPLLKECCELTPSCRKVPVDHLLRSLDPRWCCCSSRNAGANHSIPTWPQGQGYCSLHT
jgi:cytochrome c peroxidase